VTGPSSAHPVSALSFGRFSRIDKLMRAGSIYLSLRDAIALALETQSGSRIEPPISPSWRCRVDLQRASAGQLLRQFSHHRHAGPHFGLARCPVRGLAGQFRRRHTTSSNANSGVLSGLSVQLAGSTDSPIRTRLLYCRRILPYHFHRDFHEFTGTDFFVQQFKNLVYGVQQGYWTGTTVSLV